MDGRSCDDKAEGKRPSVGLPWEQSPANITAYLGSAVGLRMTALIAGE